MMTKTKLRRIKSESDIDHLLEGDVVRAVIISNCDHDINHGKDRKGYPAFYEGKMDGRYAFMRFDNLLPPPVILSFRQYRERIFFGEDIAGRKSIIVTANGSHIRIYHSERDREEYDQKMVLLERCGLIKK